MAIAVTPENSPAEYRRSDWLELVVGAELAYYDKHPLSYSPGEREGLVDELRSAGINPPQRPLLDILRVPTFMRDPRVIATIGAAFLIANR